MTADRVAAYLAATEPKPRKSREVANRRRVAAAVADIPGGTEPLSRCRDCGGLVYRRRRCRSPFCNPPKETTWKRT